MSKTFRFAARLSALVTLAWAGLFGVAQAQIGVMGGVPGLTLYVNEGYGGTGTTFTSDVPDLQTRQRRPYGGPAGTAVIICPMDDSECGYPWNDAPSSLKLNVGVTYQITDGPTNWQVWSDVNYQGVCMQITHDYPTLYGVGDGLWNDRISSIRRTDAPCPGAAARSSTSITLYQHTEYGGASVTFTSDMPDLRQVTAGGLNWNDAASSVSGGTPNVAANSIMGAPWQAWSDINYQGVCMQITHDYHSLFGIGDGLWNDRISSLRRTDAPCP